MVLSSRYRAGWPAGRVALISDRSASRSSEASRAPPARTGVTAWAIASVNSPGSAAKQITLVPVEKLPGPLDRHGQRPMSACTRGPLQQLQMAGEALRQRGQIQ